MLEFHEFERIVPTSKSNYLDHLYFLYLGKSNSLIIGQKLNRTGLLTAITLRMEGWNFLPFLVLSCCALTHSLLLIRSNISITWHNNTFWLFARIPTSFLSTPYIVQIAPNLTLLPRGYIHKQMKVNLFFKEPETFLSNTRYRNRYSALS